MGFKFTSSACSQTLPFPELQRESHACDPHPPSLLPVQKGRKKASWAGGRRAAFWGGAKDHAAGAALE